ncbi:MAG TPA: helical backbone metal receptor [Oleiagrimonas sp.]|nr:helical backbone metal receptor [Oleiagrimonas sp.]
MLVPDNRLDTDLDPLSSPTMRIFSHTCSNTEIVCALGCGNQLVGVDADSDYPPDIVANLPRPGRDLNLDVAAVRALEPDLVLTSLTVPGHERVVEALHAAGLNTVVCDPQSLDDIHADIRRIAAAMGCPERADALVTEMDAAMPIVEPAGTRPSVLVEWWPKPVITPARHSWVTDLITRAGGTNPWQATDAKSLPLETSQVCAAAPDIIVMSWCGVKVENYRADVVRRRGGWEAVPAIAEDRIVPISEAYLGRPGPRLVEGYRQLRNAITAKAASNTSA